MTAAARTVTTVGLIGAGRMGGQLGRHLLARGWPLVVADPADDARRGLVALGADEEPRPAAVAARSDLVLVAVVDDEQTRAAVAGEAGILEAARPGTVAAVCASVRPDTCRELAVAAARRDVLLLDVAMVGGERGAEAAGLTLMCGGPEEALRVCMPAFAAFATSVCYLGEVGAGQVGKAVNNVLLWAAIRADVEALRLGRALGVAPARLRPAVAVGSGGNRVLLEWGRQRLRWPHKDLETVIALADEAGVEVPLIRTLAELMTGMTVDDLYDLR